MITISQENPTPVHQLRRFQLPSAYDPSQKVIPERWMRLIFKITLWTSVDHSIAASCRDSCVRSSKQRHATLKEVIPCRVSLYFSDTDCIGSCLTSQSKPKHRNFDKK